MNEQPQKTDDRKDLQPIVALGDIGIEDRDLRVEIFTLCDGATEHGGRLSLLGTYEMIQALGFPLIVPQVTVVLRVRFWPAECPVNAFRLVLTSPDGEQIGAPIELQATAQPAREDRPTAYNLIVQLGNLRFEEPGEHSLDFYLNGKIEARLPLCIYSRAAVA